MSKYTQLLNEIELDMKVCPPPTIDASLCYISRPFIILVNDVLRSYSNEIHYNQIQDYLIYYKGDDQKFHDALKIINPWAIISNEEAEPISDEEKQKTFELFTQLITLNKESENIPKNKYRELLGEIRWEIGADALFYIDASSQYVSEFFISAIEDALRHQKLVKEVNYVYSRHYTKIYYIGDDDRCYDAFEIGAPEAIIPSTIAKPLSEEERLEVTKLTTMAVAKDRRMRENLDRELRIMFGYSKD
jgi:hypothetical protein